MELKILALMAVLFSGPNLLNAQDTIMLMKGKRLIVANAKVAITEKGDTLLNYQLEDGKQKSKHIDKVFSVNGKSGETVFYSSETHDDELTVEQMRQYLNGRADFNKGFAWGFYAGGIASVAAAAAIPPININMGDNDASLSLGIVIPFTYVLLVGNTTKSAEKLKELNPNLSDNEYYLLGAQSAISQRRMRDGALGVLTGGIIWISASCIYDANHD